MILVMYCSSFLAVLYTVSNCSAQVLSPAEIVDPALRELQVAHFQSLKAAAAEITSHMYPYQFSLSRVLDLDKSKQMSVDQRSIRFATFHNQTVVQVTGNYFASYAADKMSEAERARQTYRDVMLPILKAIAPRVESESKVDAVAIEISHHTRHKLLGLPIENAENITLIVPRATAAKIAAADDPEMQLAQLSNAQLFVDGRSIPVWLEDVQSPPVISAVNLTHLSTTASQADPAALGRARYQAAGSPLIVEESRPEDLSRTALAGRQAVFQETLDRLVRDFGEQSHFIAYAPPALVAFHNASFLQFSVTVNLPKESAGSQYRLAALAFDRQVSHMIRPVLAALTPMPAVSGIGFGASVRVDNAESSSQSVEFFFPLEQLRRYGAFDLTGQQLIDSGYVLINGERVELNLQSAEATTT
jgi:hypothetical protein